MGIYHETREARRTRQLAAVGHVVKMRVVSADSLTFAPGPPTAAGGFWTAVVMALLARASGTLPSCLDK